MQAHGTHAWLVNTGWTGGRYGVGSRMSIAHTRSIIDGIHSGELERAEYVETPIFHLKVGAVFTQHPSRVGGFRFFLQTLNPCPPYVFHSHSKS